MPSSRVPANKAGIVSDPSDLAGRLLKIRSANSPGRRVPIYRFTSTLRHRNCCQLPFESAYLLSFPAASLGLPLQRTTDRLPLKRCRCGSVKLMRRRMREVKRSWPHLEGSPCSNVCCSCGTGRGGSENRQLDANDFNDFNRHRNVAPSAPGVFA